MTCAFGPSHSDVLRLENSTLFPFHLLHGTPSAWTSLLSCHNLWGTIPSWLSSILSPSMHILFPLSQQPLPPEPHTFSSAMCGNIMVSLRKSSRIEVQFITKFTQELYWLLGIKLAATTAYHPQGDGQTNSSTRNWNNISVFSPIKDRMIGGAPAIHRIPVQQPSSFFHPAHSFPPRPWMRSSNGL